jgi:hypothetical protein
MFSAGNYTPPDYFTMFSAGNAPVSAGNGTKKAEKHMFSAGNHTPSDYFPLFSTGKNSALTVFQPIIKNGLKRPPVFDR